MNTQAKTRWQGNNTQLKSLSFAAYFLAAVLFLLSLFLPAFITQSQDILGYWVLAMGWLGFITFQFAWYALPLAIIAIRVSSRKPQFALLLAVFAILVASEAFLFKKVPFDSSEEVIDVGLGFYLWYMSFILVAGGTLFRLAAWGSHVEEVVKEEIKALPSERVILRKERKVKRVIIPIAATQKVDIASTPPPLPHQSTSVKDEPPLVPLSGKKPPPLPS